MLLTDAEGTAGGYLNGGGRRMGRGMSRWHDSVDWVGGYPYEVATPEAVFEFCRERGFVLKAAEPSA